MQDQNANVKDVQAAFYKWYSVHKPDIDNDDGAKKAGEENEEDGNYMLFKRWENMMVPRTYPSGVRPSSAQVEKDYQDFLTHRKSTHRVLSTSQVELCRFF